MPSGSEGEGSLNERVRPFLAGSDFSYRAFKNYLYYFEGAQNGAAEGGLLTVIIV